MAPERSLDCLWQPSPVGPSVRGLRRRLSGICNNGGLHDVTAAHRVLLIEVVDLRQQRRLANEGACFQQLDLFALPGVMQELPTALAESLDRGFGGHSVFAQVHNIPYRNSINDRIPRHGAICVGEAAQRVDDVAHGIHGDNTLGLEPNGYR